MFDWKAAAADCSLLLLRPPLRRPRPACAQTHFIKLPFPFAHSVHVTRNSKHADSCNSRQAGKGKLPIAIQQLEIGHVQVIACRMRPQPPQAPSSCIAASTAPRSSSSLPHLPPLPGRSPSRLASVELRGGGRVSGWVAG